MRFLIRIWPPQRLAVNKRLTTSAFILSRHSCYDIAYPWREASPDYLAWTWTLNRFTFCAAGGFADCAMYHAPFVILSISNHMLLIIVHVFQGALMNRWKCNSGQPVKKKHAVGISRERLSKSTKLTLSAEILDLSYQKWHWNESETYKTIWLLLVRKLQRRALSYATSSLRNLSPLSSRQSGVLHPLGSIRNPLARTSHRYWRLLYGANCGKKFECELSRLENCGEFWWRRDQKKSKYGCFFAQLLSTSSILLT